MGCGVLHQAAKAPPEPGAPLGHLRRPRRLWRAELGNVLYDAKGTSWSSKLIFTTNYLHISRQVTLFSWVFVFPVWKMRHRIK